MLSHYKMISNGKIVLLFCLQLSFALRFDYYTGKVASQQLIDYYKSKGNLDICTTEIEPCCASEGRRLDGSCNCLRSPSKGSFFVPPKRVLPAVYYNGSYSRKSECGEDLVWPRIIRRNLLAEGNTSDCRFTQAMTSFGISMFTDIGSIHDIRNFVLFKTDCCTKEGMDDYDCTPNLVPEDDILYRLAGISCLNLTRPLTYQSYGCTNDSIPAPVEFGTTTFDMSHIYNFLNKGEKAIRAYHGGRIIMEKENGKYWPQAGPRADCPLNRPDETRCFANHPNILVIQTLFAVWFVRLHNYFAAQLAIVNPCWDDDKLFRVTRDMVIAYGYQMYLYEWLSSLIGRKNLIKAGIISKHPGFRDIYDPTKCPMITLEFTYIFRYFHTAQDSSAKLYDEHGCYLSEFPMFNLTTRPGFLVKDKRMEHFTQGQFRQPCDKVNDHTIDYKVANNGLDELQIAVDITTSDLHKARLLGLRPYIDYLYYCTGHKITCFDDLREHMDECNIEQLKKVYKHVRDIDLMAGCWLEKFVVGGWIPRTVACLINDCLYNAIRGDRHWYEYKHRPNAFTLQQLLEMRKASLAWMLCKVGDSVTKIQRHAFLVISKKNPLVKCSAISGIDFQAWADPECSSHSCGCSDCESSSDSESSSDRESSSDSKSGSK